MKKTCDIQGACCPSRESVIEVEIDAQQKVLTASDGFGSMQRRQIIIGTTAVFSGFAGCLGAIRSNGSLREVTVELTNTNDQARTFHFALETEAGMLDWESRRIEAGDTEEASIKPNEQVSPIALHGAVDDFVGSVDVLGVDDLDEDYCLQFNFRASDPVDDQLNILFVADTRC